MRVLIFQYGDYGEAFRRFEDGGPETYRDQKSSVDFVAGLAGNGRTVVTVAICDRSYEEELAPGLRAVGISSRLASDRAAIGALLDRIAPDLLVCRTPSLPVLRWAARRGVPTLPLFADIFLNDGPRAILRNLRLRLALARGTIPCVANHSLNASRSVSSALLWPKSRTVPWDWTRLTVEDRPKKRPARLDKATAIFCGALSLAKGLDDCLEAMRILKGEGLVLSLTVAGAGDEDYWRDRASELGVGPQVEFLGLVAHDEVRRLMRSRDMVIVPSRHDYAEGLPNTIYEALAARSPLIMSDHPAFAGRLEDGQDALVFRAADPGSLADSIKRLVKDKELYERLSTNSQAAHDRLYVGIEFEDLVTAFLADPNDETGWVSRHALPAVAPGRSL